MRTYPSFPAREQAKTDTSQCWVRIRFYRGEMNGLDGLGDGEVVVVGTLLLELVLNTAPDGVAGLFGEIEEAAGLVGDGFEVADEGGAVGVVLEKLLEPGIVADVAVAVGEELRQIFFKVSRSHGVEVGKFRVSHTATSLIPAGGWAGCSG